MKKKSGKIKNSNKTLSIIIIMLIILFILSALSAYLISNYLEEEQSDINETDDNVTDIDVPPDDETSPLTNETPPDDDDDGGTGGNGGNSCTIDCSGKECGGDGCGGSCGTCGTGKECVSGECVTDCQDECDAEGLFCQNNMPYNCSIGEDGCFDRANLTECGTGEICDGGICQTVPDCEDDSDCSAFNHACSIGTCNSSGKCEITYNSTYDLCKVAVEECYLDAYCSGNSETCPANPFKAQGAACSEGVCDEGVCVECIDDTDCQTGETCENNECVASPICGDGTCNRDETCETCPQDCGECPTWNTYYIDVVNGNDNNDGSYNSPWKTITFAMSSYSSPVSTGDTIIVRPGDYSSEGTISLNRGGAAGNMITIRAEPRRQAVITKLNINDPYIRIESFEVTNNINGRDGKGISINNDNIEVVDNYIHDIWYIGINTPGVNNAYVADNYLYRVGFGIVISGNNWIVDNNEIEKLIQAVPIAQGGPDADFSRFFGRNHIIRNNYYHGNTESEIGDAHTDCYQTYNVGGSFAHNITLEKNICEGVFRQGVIARSETTGYLSDITIKNNIFSGNGQSNAWGVMGENVENMVIVNNVIANIRYFGAGLNSNSNNAVTMNNIFYNIGSDVYWSQGSNFNGDYNLIYQGAGIPYTGPHDLVNINPQFVNPTSYNFRLQSSSPAIDAGTNTGVYGITDDFEGTSRPQGNGFDIGAYEYTGLPTQSPDKPRIFINKIIEYLKFILNPF